jgi:NADH-quinone oxidoreductase subunit K
MTIGLNHYLIVSALLFVLGVYTMLSRRNVIAMLMGVELILNAANVNFIGFSRFGGINIDGQMASIFVIVIAAAEAAVALAIVLNVFKNFKSVNPADADALRD